MFHVFNKLYLDLMPNFSEVDTMSLLSETQRYMLTQSGTNIPMHVDIDHYIKSIGTTKTLFDAGLLSARKQVIYCDRTNFIKTMIRFNKTLLPNITLDSGYLLCKLVFSFYRHVYGVLGLRKNIGVTKYFMELQTPTLDEYRGYWYTCECFDYDVSRNIRKFDFSYEYLVATHLCDQTHWTSETLRNKMVYFFSRSVIDWLRTVLDDVSYALFFVHKTHPQITEGLTWQELSLENIIKLHPELSYVNDLILNNKLNQNIKFTPDLKNDELLYQAYQLINQGKTPVELVEHQTIYDSIRDGTFTPLSLLQHMIEHPNTANFGDSGFLSKQLNTHLHHYMLCLYEENDIKTLTELSLIGL